MRGKNYLSLGGVSMGIIGSDVLRNTMLHYLGMGTVSIDMVALRGRMDRGIYDHGWLAGTVHNVPWIFNAKLPALEDDVWELYDLRNDFSQADDLAAHDQGQPQHGAQPEKKLADASPRAAIGASRGQLVRLVLAEKESAREGVRVSIDPAM